MLIGLTGGICAGQTSVAHYLIQSHGFQELQVEQCSQHRADEYARLGLRSPKQSTALVRAGEPDTSSNALTARARVFATADDLIDFVLSRWHIRWVVTQTHRWDTKVFERVMLCPFFMLVYVDAPLMVRWSRFHGLVRQARSIDENTAVSEDSNPDCKTTPNLEQFLVFDDEQLYNRQYGLIHFRDRARIQLFNPSSSLDELYRELDISSVLDESRLRPNWDHYFMTLADLASQRSNCMKRRVGCVLVREKRVVSTGYNGTARNTKNCNNGGCSRCNGGNTSGTSLATCLCLHAEENALLEAGRDRIGKESILYCNTCPCLTCSVKIAQLGIAEVVYSQSYSLDAATSKVLKDAGVHLRQLSTPKNGLIYLHSLNDPVPN